MRPWMPSIARAATLVVAGSLGAAGTLCAQTIAPSVIANGGARASNGVVQITGTIGQPAIGPSSSAGANKAVSLGFWSAMETLFVFGPPQITSITPTAGITSGGTRVEIDGFNFAPGTTVNFATGAGQVVTTTPNRLIVLTPAHTPGAVDVSVSLNANVATKPSAYTYMDAGPGDTDGDGMSDACELRYSLDPLNPNDASADPDGDGKTNLEECQAGTNPHGFYKAYLAEGASNAFFQTRLALLNTGVAPATTVTEFLMPDGTVLTNPSVLPPHTRLTQDVETLPSPPVNDFSTLVESDFPLIVDRTMKWDKTGYGSHAETAVAAPAQDWFLAEGATHGRFDLFYLLQNPTSTAAAVTINYLRAPTDPPLVKTYTVGANSRLTIWVDTEDPLLAATDVSASIHSTQPIVVERSMYLSNPGQPFAGGTDAMGVTTIGPDWFLAEGATGSFFDMYVLIANPTTTDAQVQATYLLTNGQSVVKNYVVGAQSRYTISVSGEDPLLASAAMSTIVHSTNNVPIAVERAMWWPSPGNWYEGHDAVGAQTTGTAWALAEGEEGGSANTQTYVLIANTSPFAGAATVTLLFEDGTSAVTTVPLPASSRVNVDIGAWLTQAIGKRFGIVVESIGATPCQIVVERAMYSDANGVVWAAGTGALATKLR